MNTRIFYTIATTFYFCINCMNGMQSYDKSNKLEDILLQLKKIKSEFHPDSISTEKEFIIQPGSLVREHTIDDSLILDVDLNKEVYYQKNTLPNEPKKSSYINFTPIVNFEEWCLFDNFITEMREKEEICSILKNLVLNLFNTPLFNDKVQPFFEQTISFLQSTSQDKRNYTRSDFSIKLSFTEYVLSPIEHKFIIYSSKEHNIPVQLVVVMYEFLKNNM